MRAPTPILLLLLLALGRPGVAAGPAAAVAAGADRKAIRMGPARIPPQLAQRMRHWHAVYREQMAAVITDWEQVATASAPGPSETLVAGCRRLAASLDRLDRRPLLAAPDRATALHLDRFLRQLAGAAEGCTHGAYFLTTWRLQLAAASWSELGERLEVYGLAR